VTHPAEVPERGDVAATVTVRWTVGDELRVGSIADLKRAREEGCGVWVDVLAPDAEALAPLQQEFSLHPLAIEDCLHFPQRVKMDLYPASVFLVWVFPQHGQGTLVSAIELDTFLGAGFVITSHRDRVPVIDEVAADAASVLCQGAEWTLHALLDRGVDELLPIVDHLSDRLDEIEDVLLDDPVEEDLQRLYAIKRALVAIYRVVGAERDALRGMARRQQFVSQDAYMYFQDVGDHLARVVDTIDTYRDVASGAMDIYLSAVNNRLNDVMRRLTVVATVFMPLTLISGIFGMNLTKGMWPSPAVEWSFAAVVVSMIAITVGMLWYFKRKRWW
jgi:magnesium transporter